MEMAGDGIIYAATRAWKWQHGFKEVALAVVATEQDEQATPPPCSSNFRCLKVTCYRL